LTSDKKNANIDFMIHKVVIQNFFSIADQQEIILKVPAHTPDLPCFQSSRAISEERLPKVIGFFGPNASGKSTILRALAAAVEFAHVSVNFDLEAQIPSFQPYMRKDWWDKPIKLVIDFDGRLNAGEPSFLFRYELHITAHEHTRRGKEVSYESLSYAPKGKLRRIFERIRQAVKVSSEFEIKDNDPRLQSVRPNASVISTLGQLNHRLSMSLIADIKTIQTNIIALDKAQLNPNRMLAYYAENTNCLKDLNRELRRFDVGLEEMLLEQDSQGWFAKFKHSGLDRFIFMDEESSGTRRLIDIFPRLHYVLETGGIAIIDEIDADLHPLLLPELFRWFNDSGRNQKSAQLFFTAHNPPLLDELEKEQIFFTQKLTGKPTQVYRASDIKGLRRTPSLMNKYLSGELGAIPHIG